MAEKKKRADKKESAKKEAKLSKAEVISAVEKMPLASNLVLNNTKYETVKRNDVVELLKRML